MINPAEADATGQANGHELVSLRDVSLRFGSGVMALSGLNIAVRQGEFVAILGPSGCGKSTALRLLAGLLAPTAGMAARDPALKAPGRIGFVFQDPTLTPWSRTLANVRLPLDLAGTPRGEGDDRAAAMLRLVGLNGFERAFPHELSGGMRMRVSIARALTTAPDLLLMDEPFAALDEFTRFRLNDDLLQLRAELGFTVAFVTHSSWESVYLADRILVMGPRPGRVIAERLVEAPEGRGPGFRASAAYARQSADILALAAAASEGAGGPDGAAVSRPKVARIPGAPA